MRRPVGVKWVLLFFRWTRFFSFAESSALSPSFHPHSFMSDFSLGASWAFSFQQVLQPENRPSASLARKRGPGVGRSHLNSAVRQLKSSSTLRHPPQSDGCAAVHRLRH